MKVFTQKMKGFFSKIKSGQVDLKEYYRTHKVRIGRFISQAVVYIFLITIAYVFVYPIMKMISISFMSSSDLVNPEVIWLPKTFTFRNYVVSWVLLNGSVSLFNSLMYSTILAVLQTLVSAITGFAFARYEFRGKKILYTILMLSFIIPIPILLITQYNFFSSFYTKIQWTGDGKGLNTYASQIIMAFFGQGVNSAILILIFVNFFKMIPTDLYEAGKIDGANPLQLFWHITIKLSFSTIVVVFLFSFVWNWNETYVTSVFVGDGVELFTSQLGKLQSNSSIRVSSGRQEGTEVTLDEAYRMAATVISIIPLLILYFVGQKSFVEGIEKTGITGE